MKLDAKPIILVSGLLMGLLASCKDKFLDLVPTSDPSFNNFYKTANDMTSAVNAAYASLQSTGQYGNLWLFGEVRSDNTDVELQIGIGISYDEFDKFSISVTNPHLETNWRDHYTGIYRCNVVLDRIGAIPMDMGLKNQYIGEVKFLRALMYFNLVRIYGDVPLVLQEIKDTKEGYAYGRTNAAQVYAQIIQDLIDAEQLLPATYQGNDVGRATTGAAKALLGKVYLTLKKYPEAAAKLKEVINLQTYSLLPNYADIFKASNANHAESVFEVQFKGGAQGEGSNFTNSFAPRNSGTFVTGLGPGQGNNRPTADIENAYEAGDLRKEASMASGYTNAAGVFVNAKFIKKYLSTPVLENDADDNWPVLRYADVLLMYAEALNETADPTPEAHLYLNKVRRRAFGEAIEAASPQPHDRVALSQEALRLAIEQERRVELAFENHRWFDLVRTGRALEVMQAKGFNIQQYHLVFPIPQNQIDINPNKITQNTDY